MRMPGFWWRVGLALAVIAANAAWLMRPLDRSVLIPMSATPGVVEYLNFKGRVVREPRTPDNAERWNFATSDESLSLHPYSEYSSHSHTPRVRGYADDNYQLKYRIAWEKLPPEIDLVPVRQGQLWGYMNRLGEWVVLPQYSVAEVFDRGGVAIVARDEKYGCINSQGVEVIALRWGSLSSFEEDGQAVDCVDGVCGVINRKEEIVIPVQWQSLSRTSVRGLWNAQNGLWGVIDQLGNEIVPCEYDTVSPVFDGDLLCWKGNSTRTDERLVWWNQIRMWCFFGGAFPSLFSRSTVTTYDEAVYDSSANLIWRSSWFFRSWAPVWILLSSGWIGCEIIGLPWRKRRRG